MKNNGYPILPTSYDLVNEDWNPEPEPKSEMDKKEEKDVKKEVEKPKKKRVVKIEESKEDIKPEVKPPSKPIIKLSGSKKDEEIKKVNGMKLTELKEYAKKYNIPFKPTIKKSDLHKLIIENIK